MMFKFKSGRVVATPGALKVLGQFDSVANYLERHLSGDWGNLSEEDVRSNERALTNGERLLSSYMTPTNQKIWVITERDRSVTTLLLPEEY
jgi:hypothetical protein